ncbi:MAG: PEP-CTERM sorting domain-containing protein, partial [Planctomycetota bacterium]
VSVRLDEGRYQLMLMWDMLAINPAGGSSSLLDLPGPFAFDATLTPAPGTIGLLALAGLVVARRRRG